MPNQCNYSVVQSALMTGFWTDFTSSVWNFCCWVTDVPPGETSPSGDERRETSVLAGYPNTKPTKNKYKQTENKVLEENFHNTLITLLSYEKVLLFQDIFPVLIVSQEFCILLFDCCFLLVSLLESGSKCCVNNAEIRFHGWWFMSVCTFFILTKNSCIKELSIILLTHP